MKQVLVVREDLDIGVGKLAAQVAHAAVSAAEAADSQAKTAWLSHGQVKIVVRCPDLETLHELKEIASEQGLPTALISDAGRTQLSPGTVTVLGIGPAPDDAVDSVTGHLPLY